MSHTTLSIRVPTLIHEALLELAVKNERSVSGEIRHAINQHLNQSARVVKIAAPAAEASAESREI